MSKKQLHMVSAFIHGDGRIDNEAMRNWHQHYQDLGHHVLCVLTPIKNGGGTSHVRAYEILPINARRRSVGPKTSA